MLDWADPLIGDIAYADYLHVYACAIVASSGQADPRFAICCSQVLLKVALPEACKSAYVGVAVYEYGFER
jgi:hypothetical protein